MGFVFSKNSLKNREGVDPRLIEISNLALTITIIDFGHPKYAGLRTASDQQHLFKHGRSKADGIMKKSRHQSGKALDFYAFVDGKASWEKEHLAIIAVAFLQAASILGYKLKSGGLWEGFPDWPHVELI